MLNDNEKAVIIKETAKELSLANIATITGRHVDTVTRFQEDPETRKKKVKCWDFQDCHRSGFEKYCSSGTEKTWNDMQVHFYRCWTS